MSYKEYFSPEVTKEIDYSFFDRELPLTSANYYDKEVRYYLEYLPLNKQSAVLNEKK